MNEADLLSLAQQALALLGDHKWIPLAAVLLGALVRLAKTDKLGARWYDVPKRYRAAIVIALGLAAGVLEAMAAGQDWRTAIGHGVLAAALAMLGHEGFVEKLRHGRELGAPKASE